MKISIRGVARTLTGVLATLALTVSLFLLTTVQFVSSSDRAANTVESALSDSAFRNLVSERIVDKVEEENDNPTERILMSVVRQKLIQKISERLEDPIFASVVGNVVRGAYRVYIDGENLVQIDLSRFADAAREAISVVDNRLSTDFVDSFSSFEIERPRESQSFWSLIVAVQFVSWLLMAIAVLLTSLLCRHKDNRQRWSTIGMVLASAGVSLGAIVLLARIVIPQFSSDYSDVLVVFTRHLTTPPMRASLVCVVVGLLGVSVSRVSRRTI